MAEIKMERKTGGGMGWLWALIAIILLALLIWWWWSPGAGVEDVDTVGVVEPLEPVTPVEPVEQMPEADLATVLANPGEWMGDNISGTYTVAEVPTDRGFWIESNGERMFAIVVDRPVEEPVDINPQQQIRITDGTLRGPDSIGDLPGTALDPETEQLLRDQQIFMVVDEAQIEFLEAGQPQPGTGAPVTP